MGEAGEQAVKLLKEIGTKLRISVNGRVRYPDGVNIETRVVTELKNVQHQDFTQQLRDYRDWAVNRDPPYRFELWLRSGTTVSGPLQEALDNGEIVLCLMDVPKNPCS
jgi:hypothetical protein